MVNLRTLILAGLVVGTATPASATVFTVTAAGMLSNTLDDDGYFGGGDVDGAAFALTFLVDTQHAGASNGATLASDGSTLYSFSGLGSANPLSATLTINGISHNFGQRSGTLTASTLFATSNVPLVSNGTFGADNDVHDTGNLDSYSWSNTDLSQISLSFLMQQVSIFSALGVTTTYTPGPFDMAAGFFDIELVNSWYDSATGDGDWRSFSAQGGMNVHSIVVTSDAAPTVPEPATWMSMIAGFGAIGSALRFRARKVRLTFA